MTLRNYYFLPSQSLQICNGLPKLPKNEPDPFLVIQCLAAQDKGEQGISSLPKKSRQNSFLRPGGMKVG